MTETTITHIRSKTIAARKTRPQIGGGGHQTPGNDSFILDTYV